MNIFKNFFLAVILFLPQLASAQSPDGGLGDAAQGTGLIQGDVPDVARLIINGILTILGTLFLILIIIGGVRWMTSGGNSQQVDAAKTMIKNAVIGLVVVLGSYAIAAFVLEGLMGVGGQGGPNQGTP